MSANESLLRPSPSAATAQHPERTLFAHAIGCRHAALGGAPALRPKGDVMTLGRLCCLRSPAMAGHARVAATCAQWTNFSPMPLAS